MLCGFNIFKNTKKKKKKIGFVFICSVYYVTIIRLQETIDPHRKLLGHSSSAAFKTYLEEKKTTYKITRDINLQPIVFKMSKIDENKHTWQPTDQAITQMTIILLA